MKRIGIIGAMEEEVLALKNSMEQIEEQVIASMSFCQGNLNGKAVVIVRSGIGKVNMAICAQILIDIFHVTALINTGVAGSLKNEIEIGDLVISTDALQHDVDVTGFGYSLGIIPRMEQSIFAADQRLIQIAEQECQSVNPDIQTFKGRIVSGDQFVSAPEKKKQLAQEFHGFCTEMEGAAMAQAAYLNQIPFVIIRAISDKADNSAEVTYAEFEEQAIIHTVRLLKAMILQI